MLPTRPFRHTSSIYCQLIKNGKKKSADIVLLIRPVNTADKRAVFAGHQLYYISALLLTGLFSAEFTGHDDHSYYI
jgi:hypothetical protein